MKFSVEIDEIMLRSLVLQYLSKSLGAIATLLVDEDIRIEVKSKQNYRSEWESAAFRARIDKEM